MTSCIFSTFRLVFDNFFDCKMSHQNELEPVDEYVLKEYECSVCGQNKEVNVEGEGEKTVVRHYSCTSCTEKSETKMKELSAAVVQTSETRRSSRDKRLTLKMQELKDQEFGQKEKRFKSAYEKWKVKVREVRSELKSLCSEETLFELMDTVEKGQAELRELYDGIRNIMAPSQEIKRKIDACTAVTADLLKLMGVRLTEDDMGFDAEAEKARLRMLLDNEYAQSIYGSTVSKVTAHSQCSGHPSEVASISVKRAEVAAQLAAKKAELEMEADTEAKRQQFKNLERRRDIEVMEAKLRVYTEEELRDKGEQCTPACEVINPSPPPPSVACSTGQASKNEVCLVQAMQESMALTRLPVPEPSVFSGDPLKFIEWSTSFKALIEARCFNAPDKLFYLQKYIDGEARSVLEGSFYRKDEQAYQQAWKKLDERYGHSFVVHRAFREKLNRWVKIGAREYIKLREFSDFLQSCNDAIPHIKGLQVLNDCEENQKILVKLPDWVTSRWNRHVTEELDQGKDF